MFNNCTKLSSFSFQILYLVNTTNTTHMFSGCISLTSIMINSLNETYISDLSYMFNDCYSLKYVNFTNFKTSNKTNNKMEYMFRNCSSLLSIDFPYLNINKTVDYHYIFKFCDNIQYLNLSYLNADYKSNLSYLFSNKKYLISIDLSNFEAPLVDNTLEGMFFNCHNLKSIDLFSFDFSNTYNITNMFRGCFSLFFLDISNFYSSKISDFSYLFTDCSYLSQLMIDNFKGSIVRNRMDYMFNNCKSLKYLYLFNLYLEQTYNVSGMFNGCTSLLVLYFQSNGKSESEDYSFMLSDCYSLLFIDINIIVNDRVQIIMDYMFNNCSNLIKFHYNIAYTGFNFSCIKSMKFMFNNCSSLNDSGKIGMEINGEADLSYMLNNCSSLAYFDISNKLRFSQENNFGLLKYEYMFNNCTKLQNVDLSSLTIENNISLKGIFSNCISLTSVNIYKLNISNVINLSYMFENCINLTYIDLSYLNDLKQLNDLEGMFYNCNKLSSLNILNFDTSKTTNMKLMFYNCSNLISLNLTNFNTSQVTDTNNMFSNCKSFKSLNLSSFETNLVIDMSSMFQNCESLINLTIINLNTSSVKRMDNMFKNCFSLISLNITNFETKKVESMAWMFGNCRNIQFLNLSTFDTSSVTDMSSMFNGCFYLDYINMSNFTENKLIKYNNIFNNIPENLVYCLKEIEKSDSILIESINNKSCALNECDSDWKEKQQNINPENDNCIEFCYNNAIYLYQFKSSCYIQCPNKTFLSMEETYKCDYFCEENTPFYYYFLSTCMDECSPYNYFKKICTINNRLLEIQENMTEQTDKNILNDYEFIDFILEQVFNNSEQLIMQTNEQTYIINSFIKGINSKTKVNFADVQADFYNIYNLNFNSHLVVFSTEIRVKGIKIPIIQYYIYDLDARMKLNLSEASNIEINVQIKVELDLAQIDKYNPLSEYYYDPCTKSESSDGFDLIINDRIDEYQKNNYSLCEKNCEFISLDYELKTVNCKCKIKSEFKSLNEILSEKNLLNSYIEPNKRITNFFILSCHKLFFEKDFFWKNIANYIFIFLFVLLFICITFFIKYGYDYLEDEINKILISKAYLIDYEETRKNPNLRKSLRRLRNSSIHFTNDPMLKTTIFIKGSLSINRDKIPTLRKNLKLTDLEMNWNTYDFVLEKDKRSFFQYYLSLVYRKNYITFTFFNLRDYNSMSIKIYLLFFYFYIFLLINTFFFDESLIHQIYINHGKIFFKLNKTSILLSIVISKIVIFFVKYFFLTEMDIIKLKKIKEKEKISIYYTQLLRILFKRYIYFSFVNICFLALSWWYLSSFCSLYKNTQKYLLINTLISFAIALLYPFIFCFIPTIMRYYSLKNLSMDSQIIFKISRIIQIL